MRLVEFYSIVDCIPDSSRFVCCINKSVVSDIPLTEEQESAQLVKKLVDGVDTQQASTKIIDTMQIYVYEVTDAAYLNLLHDGYFTRTLLEKINAFRNSINLPHLKP